MHAEALNLWFRRASAGAGGRRPEFVWVFEDDVGFCGDDLFAELIASYDGAAADLIAFESADALRRAASAPSVRAWYWADAASAGYLDRCRRGGGAWARARGREHVQRLSARLLDRLHALARDAERPASCWREELVYSVCVNAPDLAY